MSLDTNTLLSVVCLVTLIAAITMALIAMLSKQYRPVKVWAIGDAFFVLGLLLIILTGSIPEIFSNLIGNILLGAGILVVFFGTAEFLSRPFKLSSYVVAVIAFSALFLIAYYLSNTFKTRSILIAAGGAVLASAIGIAMFLWSPKQLRFSSWIAASLFILLGVIQFIRVDRLLTGSEIYFQSLAAGIRSLDYLGIAGFILLWSVASVLMVVQRYSIELSSTARLDFLTQSYNRQAALDRLDQEVRRIQRKGGVFSLILVDLDDFKEINDEMGYPAGDATLSQVSALLKQNLRTEDMLSRWGGDEFLILLADAPLDKAIDVARRLQNHVHSIGVEYRDGHYDCSMSLGVAAYTAGALSLEETIAGADNALREAKTHGGNKINVFQKHIT